MVFKLGMTVDLCMAYNTPMLILVTLTLWHKLTTKKLIRLVTRTETGTLYSKWFIN